MSSNADEMRKRMKRRRREQIRQTKQWQNEMNTPADEERYGFERMSSYEPGRHEGNHPLFNKDRFLFKLLASACLFLFVAIMFQGEGGSLEPARSFVKKTMNDDFQFAAVATWYEKQFGKPLALLPIKPEGEQVHPGEVISANDYALPASGTIVESFEANGQGILVETGLDVDVESMNEGIVRFAGVDDIHGKTVIIQHADQTETWYGNLDAIHVSLFDFIKKGKVVGTVSESSDETKGKFYFAIKRGDDFVNPVQVIQVE